MSNSLSCYVSGLLTQQISISFNGRQRLINFGSFILTHARCLHPRRGVDSVTKQTITRHFVSHNSCRTRAWKEKRVLEACHRVISRLLANRHFNDKRAGAEVCLPVVSGIVTGDAPVSYWQELLGNCFLLLSIFSLSPIVVLEVFAIFNSV